MNKIEKLTSAQTKKLSEYRDKWIAYGLSTEPIDFEKCKEAVIEAYKCAGLEPPTLFIRLRSPLEGAIGSAILKSVGASVRASVRDSVGDSVGDSVRDSVRDSVGASVREANYGQHDANWVGWGEYFWKELGISGAEKIAGLVLVSQTCGWWWAYKNVVIITDRPCELHRDEQGRLHNPNGSAILYPDGWGVYAVHGVRVPESIILRPDSITVKQIDDESNAEVRRIMIDQYNGNKPERYLLDAGAKEIHKDTWGRLLRRDVFNDEPIVMVEVVNSTTEPDGSRHLHYLRVDPNLRPMKRKPDGTQVFGEPQKMTAHNAIASTFGLRGEKYQPLIES